MKTKSFNVERNYRISNDDQYMKARFSQEVVPDENETTEDAALRAIKQMDNIFRIAYPHVAEHLNFHVERQVNGNPNHKSDRGLINAASSVSINSAFKQTEKEQLIDQSFNLVDEINKITKPVFLKVFEKQCKTPEEKKAYQAKLKELSV